MAESGVARLLIVRHGATTNNAEGRFTGQSAAPLSPLGRRQVEALAARLRETPIDTIVSSDLPRAQESARMLAEGRGRKLTLDPDLREVSLGEWEGLTAAEARLRDPELFHDWRDDGLRHAPPQGETVEQLATRVRQAWNRWHDGSSSGGTTIWVTHGGVISILLCDALGLPLSQRALFRRDNASITEIARERGGLVVVRVNDTAHLESLGPIGLVEARQVL